jgi:hypothetical protein
METQRPVRRKTSRREIHANSFDVTCVVGTVELDVNGNNGLGPTEAAMVLIAQHGAPGTFKFPLPDGTTAVVDVSFEQPHHAE